MRIEYKTYKTIKNAQRYLARLGREYEDARIIDIPDNESGVYVFGMGRRKV